MSATADAAPGDLDATFGTAGIVTDQVFGAPLAVAVQPNGGIIALQGNTVVRHTPDGAVDLAWGTDGGQPVTFPVGQADLENLTIQPDNKIVVVGSVDATGGDDFAVARLNADGTPDATFSDDGFFSYTFAPGNDADVAYDVAIDDAGRIVVAGSGSPPSGPARAGVLRLTPQGTLDSTFSTDGVQTVDVSSGDDDARTVGIDSKGRVVVAGWGGEGAEDVLVLARLTDLGDLDNGWSTDGKTSFEFVAGESDKIDDLAVQPDDKVLIAGGPVISATNPTDLTVARFDADGELDDGFGTAGISRQITAGVSEHAEAVAVQPDGKLVLGGYIIESGSRWDFLAARLDSTGALDPSFGTGGLVRTDVTPNARDQATAMALQPDGRVVLAGGYARDPNNPFLGLGEALVRLIGVEAKVSLTGAGAGAPRAGETASYTFTVNAGDGDFARGAHVIGSVPGTEVVGVAPSQGSCSGTAPFECRLGDIPSGGSATITVTARSATPATITATAEVANRNWDPALADNLASAAITWTAAAPGPRPGPGSDPGTNPGPGTDPGPGGNGGPGVPPPPNKAPDTVVKKLAGRITAKKLKAFTGTAKDDASLARVEIALVRREGKKACYWLTSNKAKFKKKRANRRGECTGPVWLRASGTTRWSYKLKKTLPKGKYVVYARATDRQGLVEKEPSRRSFTLR